MEKKQHFLFFSYTFLRNHSQKNKSKQHDRCVYGCTFEKSLCKDVHGPGAVHTHHLLQRVAPARVWCPVGERRSGWLTSNLPLSCTSALHWPDNRSQPWAKVQERLRCKRGILLFDLNKGKTDANHTSVSFHSVPLKNILMKRLRTDLVLLNELASVPHHFHYLIYSSPHCCIATSQPSRHVHHADLFIIPETRRARYVKLIDITQSCWKQQQLQIPKC